jgi:hypothetical protein
MIKGVLCEPCSLNREVVMSFTLCESKMNHALFEEKTEILLTVFVEMISYHGVEIGKEMLLSVSLNIRN